jgi:hypothetical protein
MGMMGAPRRRQVSGSLGGAEVISEIGMRSSICFWQMPTDGVALFEFLHSTGPLVARRHKSLPESKETAFRPLSHFRRQDFGIILICRKSDVEAVQIDRYDANDQSWSTVNADASPVLMYSREPLHQRDLFRSTLGAALDYVHLPTGESRKKDPEFKKWAKSIVAWMKARCTETCKLHGFDYSATQAVAAALKKGKIVLRN